MSFSNSPFGHALSLFKIALWSVFSLACFRQIRKNRGQNGGRGGENSGPRDEVRAPELPQKKNVFPCTPPFLPPFNFCRGFPVSPSEGQTSSRTDPTAQTVKVTMKSARIPVQIAIAAPQLRAALNRRRR